MSTIHVKVVGYPQNPGCEGNSPLFVAMDRCQSLQERLLREVLSGINILGHVQEIPVNAANVPLVQLPESLTVSRYRLVDESRIVRRLGSHDVHWQLLARIVSSLWQTPGRLEIG